MLRQYVSQQLSEVRLKLGQVQETLARDIVKAMEHAEPLGQIDTRIQGLSSKIQDAPVGYAGFFDAIKIREEELERIYQFDESMMAYADLLGNHVEALQTAVEEDGDISAAVRTLQQASRDANSATVNGKRF